MAADELTFKPGDTDNNLLRKILGTLENGLDISGGTINIPGAITASIADGADTAEGSRADPAETNPAAVASIVSLLKGILTIDTQSNSGVAQLNTATGLINSAAVTNPASNASVIAALKGILTGVNSINTNTGAPADAAVTNPASSASIIAAIKGLLTLITTGNAQLVTNNNVGGYTTAIKDTTAVSATPDYSIGDAVGGKRTLTNAVRVSGGTGVLESVILLDRANQKAGMELFIFDSDPTAATITDNAAFVFSTDDLKVIARVSISSGDYVTINSKAVAVVKGLGIALKASGSTSLYAALVTTGAPNLAATDDIQLIYGILQD